jgi:hypothetical protein
VYIDGSNWNYVTNSFLVTNTVWNLAPGTAYISANQLQGSSTDTKVPLGGSNSQNIYFGIGVPSGQIGSGSGSYSQTVNIISVC